MIHSLILYAKLILPRLGVTSEEGQTLAEYALIFLLIVIVVIIALTQVGDELVILYNSIVNGLPF